MWGTCFYATDQAKCFKLFSRQGDSLITLSHFLFWQFHLFYFVLHKGEYLERLKLASKIACVGEMNNGIKSKSCSDLLLYNKSWRFLKLLCNRFPLLILIVQWTIQQITFSFCMLLLYDCPILSLACDIQRNSQKLNLQSAILKCIESDIFYRWTHTNNKEIRYIISTQFCL